MPLAHEINAMSDVTSNEINAMQMSQAAERMQEKNDENM